MSDKRLPSFGPYHKLLLVVIGLIIALALVGIFWPKATVSKPLNTLETFATCLKNKGLVMYGNDTCPNCQNQKKMFAESFDIIDYVNCDFHKDVCDQQQITAYPVWVYGNSRLIGLQPLTQLSSLTKCSLPPL